MKTKRTYNPIFILYAKSKDLTPEACLKADEKKFSGGRMCGFILWSDKQLHDFDVQEGRFKNDENTYIGSLGRFYIRDTQKYMEWLTKKYSN